MSWSPILSFAEHVISGFERWYLLEVLLKHMHVAPFIRFLVSMISFVCVVYDGYMEHIACDIEKVITKSELTASVGYIISGLVETILSIVAVVYYYKFGKETIELKMFNFFLALVNLLVAVYYLKFSQANQQFCTRDIYGQWIDLVVGHLGGSIIYGYWLYSARQGEKLQKKEMVEKENNLSDVILISLARPRSVNGNTTDIIINYNDNDSDNNLDIDYLNSGNIDSVCKYAAMIVSRVTGAIIVLLYAIIVFSIVLVQFIFINGRIYLLGVVSCFGVCKRLERKYIIEKKRISLTSVSDYLLYCVTTSSIFGLKQATKYFLENEPVKYYFNHGAMIFFSKRYLRYIGSGIPDYNLKYPNYITYNSLHDNCTTTYNRLLPECNDDEYLLKLPPIKDVMRLFIGQEDKFIVKKWNRLSALGGFYIRWFTYQFSNKNEFKPKETIGPVGINLSQLYGFTIEDEAEIRSFKNGLLKSVMINNKEFPVVIVNNSVGKLKVNEKRFLSPWSKVSGVEGVDFFCIQLLFWRHHQWIARQIKKYYRHFDDEKIYQITKLCNILTCMQIALNLYGIMGMVQPNTCLNYDYYDFENFYNNIVYKFSGPASKLFPSCNSTNAYIEFGFMCTWNQLIPPVIKIMNNEEYKKQKQLSGITGCTTTGNNKNNNKECICSGKSKIEDTDNENGEEKDDEKEDDMDELRLPYENCVDLLTRTNGLERFLLSSSKSLFNTKRFLCETEIRDRIFASRFYKFQSFNNYRERLGFEKYDSFEELSDDKILCQKLKVLYKDIDNLEYYVGLFADDGSFLTKVFSSIVFSLITSSKLLTKDWNTMLTPIGKKIAKKYTTIGDLIELHTDLKKNDVTWKH